MIYFIKNVNDNAIKIGYSSDPRKRLSSLRIANSSPLKLIAVMEGDKAKEGHIHLLFSRLRIRARGEWFLEDQELIDFMAPYAVEEPIKNKPGSINGRLRDLVNQSGLTYAAVAARAGMKGSSFSRLLTDSRGPTLDSTRRILVAIGCDWSHLNPIQ